VGLDPGAFEMGEIVNLRTMRKRAKREQEDVRAEASRLRHGQSKTVRALEEARRSKADHDLDQHRIDTGDRQ
jgi:hypothetical protein